jgi:hypothetical protein
MLFKCGENMKGKVREHHRKEELSLPTELTTRFYNVVFTDLSFLPLP